MQKNEERIQECDESDRLRVEFAQRHEQELAQQAMGYPYPGQGCSQPSCTQEPMNQFAGQELCGGHTLVIIDPNNEVHRAGYGPWG